MKGITRVNSRTLRMGPVTSWLQPGHSQSKVSSWLQQAAGAKQQWEKRSEYFLLYFLSSVHTLFSSGSRLHTLLWQEVAVVQHKV